MSFVDKMKETLDEEYNVSVTENGAVGYRTTGKEILDFNFKIASYRSKSEKEIINDFEKIFLDNKVLAMQFLFFIRDREEGLGERRLFRVILKHLANEEPEMIKKVIPLIAEYGRYDDLLELFDTKVEDSALATITCQLAEDLINEKENKPISLLAKWLPSINSASEKTRKKAFKILDKIGDKSQRRETMREYRKTLSRLRKYIDVTERKMCANNWGEIKYENVPSRANLNYNNAFLKHDEERRREFLEKVNKGEAKINSSKVFPHDIIHKYMKGGSYRDEIKAKDETLEAMWKALPKKEIENTLVVADGSGSMTLTVGNTKITALDVANALAIYFAENNVGEFNNQYITFSENPQLVSFKGLTTLRDKIKKALCYGEVADTNIEKVFNLILDTAVKNNLSQEEIPKNILIISDMEFNSCVHDNSSRYSVNEKLFNVIGKRYENNGYKLPKLVFWNVNSRTGTIPVKENDLGVALVSGFSTNIAEMVMSCELDPLEVLLKKLNTPRYLAIKEVLEKD